MTVFVAIVGSRHSGKSTIIKSLTGCPSAKFRGTVSDIATRRTIEVICSSPQELPLTLAELQTILRRGAKKECNGVVCALQSTNPSKRLTLEQVLREAISFHYQVHTFVLDPEHGGLSGYMARVHTRLPSGALPPVALDARRFAHLNATIVHACTSIAA